MSHNPGVSWTDGSNPCARQKSSATLAKTTQSKSARLQAFIQDFRVGSELEVDECTIVPTHCDQEERQRRECDPAHGPRSSLRHILQAPIAKLPVQAEHRNGHTCHDG